MKNKDRSVKERIKIQIKTAIVVGSVTVELQSMEVKKKEIKKEEERR